MLGTQAGHRALKKVVLKGGVQGGRMRAAVEWPTASLAAAPGAQLVWADESATDRRTTDCCSGRRESQQRCGRKGVKGAVVFGSTERTAAYCWPRAGSGALIHQTGRSIRAAAAQQWREGSRTVRGKCSTPGVRGLRAEEAERNVDGVFEGESLGCGCSGLRSCPGPVQNCTEASAWLP